jgi:hypothetical protein
MRGTQYGHRKSTGKGIIWYNNYHTPLLEVVGANQWDQQRCTVIDLPQPNCVDWTVDRQDEETRESREGSQEVRTVAGVEVGFQWTVSVV